MTGWIDNDYSRKDVKKGIITPTEVTPKLAELIGIVVGDGHVTYTTKNRKEYDVCISGSIEDFEKHHKPFIIPVFRELFNAEPCVKLRCRGRDECETVFQSKMIASFFHKKLGIPCNKRNVEIPEIIRNGSTEIKKAFIRGLFDTDGCFCIKKQRQLPVIGFLTISDPLFREVKSILHGLDIKFSAFESYTRHKGYEKISHGHKIEISGKNNVNMWLQAVGFRNEKYNDRIRKWTRGELNSGDSRSCPEIRSRPLDVYAIA